MVNHFHKSGNRSNTAAVMKLEPAENGELWLKTRTKTIVNINHVQKNAVKLRNSIKYSVTKNTTKKATKAKPKIVGITTNLLLEAFPFVGKAFQGHISCRNR